MNKSKLSKFRTSEQAYYFTHNELIFQFNVFRSTELCKPNRICSTDGLDAAFEFEGKHSFRKKNGSEKIQHSC